MTSGMKINVITGKGEDKGKGEGDNKSESRLRAADRRIDES